MSQRACVLVGWLALFLLITILFIKGPGTTQIPTNYGPRNGIIASQFFQDIYPGTYAEFDNGGLNYLVPKGWSESFMIQGHSARYPLENNTPHAIITAVPGKKLCLLINGFSKNGRKTKKKIQLSLSDPVTDKIIFETKATLNEPILIPGVALYRSELCGNEPGIQLGLSIISDNSIAVTKIRADGGINFMEAESFRNSWKDGGGDCGYTSGRCGSIPHNGMMVKAYIFSNSGNICLEQEKKLEPGKYKLWARVRITPQKKPLQTIMEFKANGQTVGKTEGFSDYFINQQSVLDDNFNWLPIGVFNSTGKTRLKIIIYPKKQMGKSSILRSTFSEIDLDALAFVPVSIETM